MGGIGPTQILIIVLILILLFGAKKLPDAARSLGRSMRVFRSEVKEMKHESERDAIIDGEIESPKPTTNPVADPAANPTHAPDPLRDETPRQS